MKQVLSIPYQLVNNEDLDAQDKQLEAAASAIAEQAYAPYSNFRVGAAALLENGIIVTGSNQENAAYPSGLCAERTALFYAGAQYPDVPVVALAVVAYNKDGRVAQISPCGGCRQVLMETAIRFRPFRLLLCGSKETIILEDCRQVLPFGFDGSDL
ncbi:MAG: cytidine deaminase [Porphyromonas sp.]|nr:cytidine deaminase [Porphyromonas sp.]